ncbi:uncharacterized protein LOC143909575 [Arctopsyche grandis]|uniref:uncharacterized protein LOC143909575 n=1 Tax=Arctopsyche grandis TaxID=121162 RepID=UPI00406D721A
MLLDNNYYTIQYQPKVSFSNMSRMLCVLFIAIIIEVSPIVCAGFENCEFRLNQTSISDDSVLPTSCQTLSETDKRIWEDENDMLDKYFQTLDIAQTKLSKLSSID